MYKAIVVDDENFDLEGMRRLIPWAELNIEVLCWENRPLAALDFIENNELDILITDIKMPVLSGLELAKRAHERNNALKKVFISGYQDFTYAKQALDLKADAYVLKPVDDDELIETLRRIVKELDEEQDKQETLVDSFEFIKNDVVLHLLDGSIDEQTLQAFVQKYPLQIPLTAAAAVLVEIDRLVPLRQQGALNLAESIDATMELVTNYIQTSGLGLSCKVSETRIGLIYTATGGDLEHQLQKLLDHVRKRGVMTVTISCGGEAAGRDALVQSFGLARELMSYKMFLGKNRLILSSEAKPQVTKEAKDINEILEQMFTATANYQLVTICDCVEELFELVTAFEHPVRVTHFSMHIVMKLEHYLSQINEDFHNLLGWGNGALEHIQQFETVQDIQSWLRRTLFEISERLFTKKQRGNYKLLNDISNYVKQRLSEEITLKEVANHFAYSPNHLGHLFKESMGTSFNEYVVMCRMEQAKQLLQNHKLKVYEVADQIGYKSLTYFSRTFREYVGMTPGDYRKQS
ncbi:helix-turn-helix domain-containing protein [Paenibacillaceae bacterium]|nr:helix-turn-helix domain-containing protein [Paenibacillaceae bacterium]